jgi:hypothetical protein
MTNDAALRTQLARFLDWREAHASFEMATEGIPAELRGTRPEGLPYSPWKLVEHMRITQRDILDFCRDPHYHEPPWPDHYWPQADAPPSEEAWTESLAAFRRDREGMKALAADTQVDLFAAIPWGSGQTYIREILLVADHTAYHVGELVVVRRMLGVWK